MEFSEKLATYAELLVCHGLNVQAGQVVNIAAEACHRDFCVLLTDAAYRRGAKLVMVDLIEPRSESLRIIHSDEDNLRFVPGYIPVKYRELVDETAANLRIVGSEDPDLLSTLDPKKINTLRQSQRKAVKYFFEEGIGKSLVHWTVAAAATPKWGNKVFPNAAPSEAATLLWDAIFKICRADQSNCLELWRKHNEKLQERARKLSALNIKTLHFCGGGTDLKVGLSPKSVFKGGGDISPRGVQFEPNIPTEEVFTTPDWRTTEGTAKATRPFLVNGKMIRGLVLRFKQGVIVDFEAQDGKETFKEYINSDEGAKRLGEVALVGIDSPVFKSGLVFEEILFDENAACHIAIGLAYKFCLEGGTKMSATELEEVGCNISAVHTDIMISSGEVSVDGETYSGKKLSLIKNGSWVI